MSEHEISEAEPEGVPEDNGGTGIISTGMAIVVIGVLGLIGWAVFRVVGGGGEEEPASASRSQPPVTVSARQQRIEGCINDMATAFDAATAAGDPTPIFLQFGASSYEGQALTQIWFGFFNEATRSGVDAAIVQLSEQFITICTNLHAPAPAPASTVVNPQQGRDSEVGPALDSNAIASPISTIDGTAAVLAVSKSGTVIYTFTNGEWSQAAQFDTAQAPHGALNISVEDVTGDGEPDFIVSHMPNSTFNYVYTTDGGPWLEAPFQVDGEEVVTYRSDWFEVDADGQLVTTENMCDPSCADGNVQTFTWSYDRSQRMFVTDGPQPAPTLDELIDKCVVDVMVLIEESIAVGNHTPIEDAWLDDHQVIGWMTQITNDYEWHSGRFGEERARERAAEDSASLCGWMMH